MGLSERRKLINQIEDLRDSKVITYLTSDRRTFPPGFSLPGLNTMLATESQAFLYDQLRSVGRQRNIDLFLYTRGGETDSVWPLVSIFREYASERFAVLVPFRAHSAGTLICLGADEIVLGEAAELSPVDPTTGNQFNPPMESGDGGRKGISVEDVTAYFDLARDERKVGLKADDHILEVFKRLAEEVHPIALGNVNRAHTQIRSLARRLLGLHLTDGNVDDRIGEIVDLLTTKLYSHSHALNRTDVIQILGESCARRATEDEQQLMWQLYEEYAEVMKLQETFCADCLTTGSQEQTLNIVGGFIESGNLSLAFRSQSRIRLTSRIPQGVQVQIPPGQSLPLIPGLPLNIDVKVLTLGWEKSEEG